MRSLLIPPDIRISSYSGPDGGVARAGSFGRRLLNCMMGDESGFPRSNPSYKLAIFLKKVLTPRVYCPYSYESGHAYSKLQVLETNNTFLTFSG